MVLFFQAEDGIRDLVRSRGLGDVYKRQDDQSVSLEDYISRMAEGQEKIYYITAESYNAALNSPHLEIFKKKGIEVLLMSERIDEWMMGYLTDFDGKHFQHVGKGELDLGELEDENDKKEKEEIEKASEDFIKRVKDVLEDKVDEVRVTTRLTDSPACIVLNAHDMGAQMRQIMEAAGQSMPGSKPSLEINPSHPLIERLKEEIQEDRFEDLTKVIFDQASLAEGGSIDDPSAYVLRINKLLLELSQ